ncbi:MAG: hypothetical protein ACPGVG_14440 [Mycobacterium sp.]
MPPNKVDILEHETGDGERLSGAGAADRSAQLDVGALYTLFVGAVDITFATGGSAVDADASSIPLGAFTKHDLQIVDGGDYVSIFPYDGSSTAVANIVKSSP